MRNRYPTDTVSQMPPTLLAQPKPYDNATCELIHHMAESLTDWIRSTRYRIPVREPEGGEIVRIQPESPIVRNWLHYVTDETTGEAFRVSHDVLLPTHGKFQDCYGWMRFALFITEHGELALWPLWSLETAQAVDKTPDAWVRVLNPRSASISFCVLPDIYRPEPVWPEFHWEDLADRGFRGRVIYKLDHPLICRVHKQGGQDRQGSHE